MNKLLTHRSTIGNGGHEYKPKPALLLSLLQTAASLVRSTHCASHPRCEQVASLKEYTSGKRCRVSNRLRSHARFAIVCIGLCFLGFRPATAQGSYESGCESASDRTTVGGASGIRLRYQGVLTQLQTCPPENPLISELPDAPSAVVLPTISTGLTAESSPSELDVRDLAIESYTGKEPKTIDHQFLMLNALLVISAVADAESTLLCSRCQEINPLLGSHPTRQRIYAIGVPLTVFQIYLAYHYKRLSPTRNGVITGWKAFPIAFAAAHGLAAVNNFLVAHYTQ